MHCTCVEGELEPINVLVVDEGHILFSKSKAAEPLWQKMKALADGTSQSNLRIIFCALYGLSTAQLAMDNARVQTPSRALTRFPALDSSSHSSSRSRPASLFDVQNVFGFGSQSDREGSYSGTTNTYYIYSLSPDPGALA